MQSAREPGLGHAQAAAIAGGPSGAPVWQRRELFGCVALAALGLGLAGPMLNAAGPRPCQTQPALLTPGADLDVRMTVAHNAACAIWSRADNVSVRDLTITTPPQHGTLALRGRTGVTYRPAGGFNGEDAFAFAIHGTRHARHQLSRVRVQVTVN